MIPKFRIFSWNLEKLHLNYCLRHKKLYLKIVKTFLTEREKAELIKTSSFRLYLTKTS